MPDFSASFSKFFKAEDVKLAARTLTIKSAGMEIIESENGAKKESKPVLRFVEDERGLVLNKGRNDALVEALGLGDWAGAVVEMFFDPNVKFGGKKVGGIGIKVVSAKS